MVVPIRSTGMGSPPTVSLRRRLEQHFEELPVLPAVVVQLMSLDPEDAHCFEHVRRLIESEPAFSARLLALANSAASAPRQPIVSVRDALQRVGTRQAVNLLLATAVARVFVPRDEWEKCLWRHSLEVAVLARALATRGSSVDPEHAYTCGLLHDLGRFILFQEAPAELHRIEQAPWRTPDELLAAERSLCGLTHSELGALACRKWRLPEVIASVVATHHSSFAAAGNELARLVQLSDWLMFSSVRPDGAHRLALREPGSEAVAASLTESQEELDAIVDEARAEADGMARTLGVHCG